MRGLVFFAALILSTLVARAKNFDCRADTIAFSNDTVFSYGVDESGVLKIGKREKPAEFTHRCFVLCRAVMQFHKFARFAPNSPRLSPEEYRRLARQIFRVPVWASPDRPKFVVPGYANLHDFSRAHEHMLKEEIGNWLPSYFRVGNWRIVLPFPRCTQRLGAMRLVSAIERGDVQAVYLSRFPFMNHCVVLFGCHRQKNGDILFDLYHPNYPAMSSRLFFKNAESSFDFEKRWYWPGGRVNLMRVYISPIH